MSVPGKSAAAVSVLNTNPVQAVALEITCLLSFRLFYIICWQTNSADHACVFVLPSQDFLCTLDNDCWLGCICTACYCVKSLPVQNVPFFHAIYKKNPYTIGRLRWDMFPRSPSSPLSSTGASWFGWQRLQMMMLFPNESRITHVASADHWVQQVDIPLR